MEIQGSSSLYNENVDNYSEPLKDDDSNIVNLHGIAKSFVCFVKLYSSFAAISLDFISKILSYTKT